MAKQKKVVLAYSGGLDTSVILRWLIETHDLYVIAACIDLGQGEDLAGVKKKAAETGARKSLVINARQEFATDFIFPALRANARYEDLYLMGTSLARPLIARKLVETALAEGAACIAHGATGKGNDQVRFELTAAALAPDLGVVAPWRDPAWNLSSRPQMIEYARERGIPVPVTAEKPYSSDANLMHVSCEGGVLEDPWNPCDESMFTMTVSPEKAPARPEYVTVEFKSGNPVKLNGRKYAPVTLIEKLNRTAGRHGVGRVDMVENRFVGMKSRGVYETPGVTVLHAAHRAVESITLDREAMFLKDSLMPQYARLAYNGFWYSPEREALQALIDDTQEHVSGTARLKLYKGSCMVVGRKSQESIYDQALVSFDRAGGYDQKDATGFIKLNAIRLRARAARGKKASKTRKKSAGKRKKT